MEYTYEELLAENAALKECIETQKKTIDRLISAYILIDSDPSQTSERK